VELTRILLTKGIAPSSVNVAEMSNRLCQMCEDQLSHQPTDSDMRAWITQLLKHFNNIWPIR